jgi:hypothetical protein
MAGGKVFSDQVSYRLKGLFLPVVALSAGLLAVYSLFNWIFLAGPQLAPLDDNVIDYWIPLTLAGFLEFALVAPRLQFLALGKRHTLRVLYNVLAFAILAAPVCLARTISAPHRVISPRLRTPRRSYPPLPPAITRP